MVEKFPAHPGMVINKLSKVLEQEKQRSETLVQEIKKVRDSFGLADSGSPPTPGKSTSPIGRRLASISYEPGLPTCPTVSPLLLGPLVVKTKLSEEEGASLEPGSEAWTRWFGALKEGGSYSPEECQPRQKVAIIVPYRCSAYTQTYTYVA